MAFRKYTGKGGKYRIQFKHRGQTHSRVVKTKREGEAWKVETLKQLKKAERMETTDLTCLKITRRYLKDCDARMQPQTVNEKVRHVREFAEYVEKSYPDLEEFLVEQVSIELARKFIAHIQKTKTNKTANRYLRTLKACWNWNIRQGENIGNPFSKVEKYPEEVYVKKVPSTQDVVSGDHGS